MTLEQHRELHAHIQDHRNYSVCLGFVYYKSKDMLVKTTPKIKEKDVGTWVLLVDGKERVGKWY